jgi:predicted Rossmann fold nucleotide-binding protein DprA/Smf involved in DNA uptake
MGAAESVSDDTRAIMALCASLGQRGAPDTRPLSNSEYHGLTLALRELQRRPSSIFEMADAELRDLAGRAPTRLRVPIDPIRLRRLIDRGALVALRIADLHATGLWVLGRGDEAYPVRYRRLGSLAPPLLYGCGPLEHIDRGGLAVVGSRKAGEPALTTARAAGTLCAKDDVAVVSGAARGVDEAAMFGSIEAGGVAVGVLSDSLLKTALRRDYRNAIVERSLALLTPYEPDAPFSVGRALGRNRFIYALAQTALVVVTAHGSGGTWAGAVEALRSGHTVYVIDDETSEGNRALTMLGARPLTGVSAAMFATELVEAKAHPASATEAVSDAAALFAAVKPHVLQALGKPRGAHEIARALDLTEVQVQRWLDALIGAGEVEVIGASYRLVDRNQRRGLPQLSLLPAVAAPMRVAKRSRKR